MTQAVAKVLRDTFRVVHPQATEVGTANQFKLGTTTGDKIDYIFVEPGTEVISADIVRTVCRRALSVRPLPGRGEDSVALIDQLYRPFSAGPCLVAGFAAVSSDFSCVSAARTSRTFMRCSTRRLRLR